MTREPVYCFINSQWVSVDKAVVSIHDRGFRYGDGVFETIAVHKGALYQFDWHMQRLQAGLEATGIDADTRALPTLCRTLLEKNAISYGLLRLQITRGTGSKGYLPDPTHPQAGACVVLETLPMPDVPTEPVRLWLSRYSAIATDALPAIKSCQGLHSTLARMEAQANQCFDALVLNQEGHVCETSSANIFWRRDSVLYTPSLTTGALPGSTRAALMRLSPYPVKEVEVGLDGLQDADSVFITNVAWRALAVSAIGNGLLFPRSVEISRIFSTLLDEDRERAALGSSDFPIV